jgi:hypothetical protein
MTSPAVYPPTTETTTTITNKTTVVDQKITAEDTLSQSISNYTESILYVRSRNVLFKCERLKPITKHYAFFNGVSVDEYITSKFFSINMISGIFQIGELVQSDPLFTASRFSFRLCAPNHLDGPYQNPSKVFINDIIRLPLAERYGLSQTNYSESSKILNVDLYSLTNPTEVEFSGYARPKMKLIGTSSGAIAEVVESLLITDESGFLSGSFFIPDPTIQTNPRFINGTNSFTIKNVSDISNSDYLSFTESQYYSAGTTNVTDVNNITTRNYTITPSVTINETTITNTTSNIITQINYIPTPPPPPPPPPSPTPPPPSPSPTVKTATVTHFYDDLNNINISLTWGAAITSVVAVRVPSTPSDIRYYDITFSGTPSSSSVQSYSFTGANGGSQPTMRVKSYQKLSTNKWRLTFERLYNGIYINNFNREFTLSVTY